MMPSLDAAKEAGRRVLTVPEAGAILGKGRSAAYQAARDGYLPTLRTSARGIVVPIDALEQMLRGSQR